MNHNIQEDTSSWMGCMRCGNFEKAWTFSDATLKSHAGMPCWHLPRHLQYIWDGKSLKDKRVLVRCYHGLGDTIQFIRYAPLLKEIAKEVIIWAQPELISLLETVDGIDRLLPLHNGSPDVDYDADVELMELPHIFRTTVATIPGRVPYLHVNPLELPSKQRPAVGLVWKAGGWDEQRSISFSSLHPLFESKGVNFYILQAGAQAAGWSEGFGIHPGEFDLYEYARFIRGLDLVISVDSMPAHLAGALGVPIWNLVRVEADWRWMQGREDSPWYPTMRIFRQEQPGDWESVIRRVAGELRKHPAYGVSSADEKNLGL